MDVLSIAITASIAVASGGTGAALWIWKSSGSWHTFKTKTETQITSLENKDKELKKDVDDLTRETQDFAEQQGIQWQQINRSLGQIEGALGVNPPPNPRRSRPT
jgi:peptidoglycan hydrolase CwlO-like protein